MASNKQMSTPKRPKARAKSGLLRRSSSGVIAKTVKAAAIKKPRGVARRDDKLELRIAKASKERLQEAASLSGRSLSDFVIRAATVEAEMALAGQSRFLLGHAAWAKFCAALDAPVRPMPRMKRLLADKSIVE